MNADKMRENLVATLRERIADLGSRKNYYLSEEEYRIGRHLGLYGDESRVPQGSGVCAVSVTFEDQTFTCSLAEEVE